MNLKKISRPIIIFLISFYAGEFGLIAGIENSFSKSSHLIFKRDTCSPDKFHCKSGQCLAKELLCDGYTNCQDGDDEKPEVCQNNTKCKADAFHCASGVCLEQEYLCDGVINCYDGDDEAPALCQNNSCSPDEFHCKDGQCLAKELLCDGYANCLNSDDEKPEVCQNNTKCKAGQFHCASGACINRNRLCDGYTDCYDRDDEAPALCKNKSCSPDKFYCKSGQCLAKELLCDGYTNCLDGDDEKPEVCQNNTKCKADAFHCASGVCLEQEYLCDGVINCYDGDDEAPALCQNNSCSPDEFHCKDGQCLAKELLCDGYANCLNSDDEKPEVCQNNTKCKAGQFHCASGACINRNRLCDGYTDCYDRDDEAPALCKNKSCSPDKFYCKSGQCLAKELLCDGYTNCLDGDDEKPEVCQNNTKCKADAFHCASGVCLEQEYLCDGVINCYDGDDEAPALCQNNSCSPDEFHCKDGQCLAKELLCDGYANCLNSDDEKPEVCQNNTKTETIASYCILPSTYIENTFTCSNDINKRTCWYEDGKKVYHAERVTVKCKEGYQQVAGNASESVCFDGKWYPPISKCYKTCPQMKGQNMQFNGKWDKPLPECVPVIDCGRPRKTEVLIRMENPEERGGSPWHVAIYERSVKLTDLICGGTIITAQLIVSAAHCFINEQTKSIEDPKKYEVVVAKYTLNYTSKDENDTKIFKIREIFVSDTLPLPSQTTHYAADIAILWISEKITFSQNVMPACVDLTFRGHYIAPENATGKVSGWGITESEKQSPILLTTFLPFINLKNCSTMVNSEFADSIAADAFCAGIKNETGVGRGDSGGGILFNQTDLQGTIRYYLRGITSHRDKTIRTDGTTYIAVFTDVAQHIDLIRDVQKKIET